MYETLEICIDHAGKTKCFHAVFSRYGYSYRIVVDIKNIQVIFEPDEERQWRARVETGMPDKETYELIPLLAAKLNDLL